MDERKVRRFATMDGLRGVAAIGVMLYHYTYRRHGGGLSGGPFAVDVFFCLSGFVIAFAYGERLDGGLGFAAFARARLTRLYPMYALGLLLGLVNYAAGGAVNAPGLVALAFVSGALMLPTFAPFAIGFGAESTNAVLFPFNPPAWSLSDELLCNALFAFFRPRGWRLAATLAVALAAFIATGWVAGAPAGWGRDNWWAGPPRALFSFYAGVALCDLWRAGRLDFPLKAPWLPLAAVAIAMFCPTRPAWFLPLAVLLGPASVALAIEAPASAATRRVFDRLGALSYPLYAIHVPALGLMRLGYNALAGAPAEAVPPMAVHLGFAGAVIAFSLWLAARIDAPARRWLQKPSRDASPSVARARRGASQRSDSVRPPPKR